MKGHVLHGQIQLLPRRHRIHRAVGDFAGRFKQFYQALCGACGPLQVAPDLRNSANGTSNNKGVKNKGGQVTGRGATREHVLATDPNQGGHSTEDQEHHYGHQHSTQPHALQSDTKRALHHPSELSNIQSLMIKGLYDFYVTETLADMTAHVGQPILAAAGQGSHSTPKNDHRQHNKGHTGQHDQ